MYKPYPSHHPGTCHSGLRDDGVAHFLELSQIIDHQTAKESGTIFQSRLINNDSCTLGLDALHNALNRALAEVIAVALHGQTVHADGYRLLLLLIVFIVLIVSIVTRQLQDTISDEFFTSSVALDNSFDQVLRHIGVVSQQLLGIFGQAVSAVTEGRIIVVAANTRIKANTVDDLLGVQTLALCISIQFIEVSHAQSQICIGKQLNGLCLGKAHEQSINVLFNCTFLQQTGKLVSGFNQTLIAQVSTNDNTARIQIVIQSLGFTQELRAEDDVLAVKLLTHACGVANRNGGLNYHDGIRIVLHNQFDYGFDCARVEVLRVAVVV